MMPPPAIEHGAATAAADAYGEDAVGGANEDGDALRLRPERR